MTEEETIETYDRKEKKDFFKFIADYYKDREKIIFFLGGVGVGCIFSRFGGEVLGTAILIGVGLIWWLKRKKQKKRES